MKTSKIHKFGEKVCIKLERKSSLLSFSKRIFTNNTINSFTI